MSCNFQLPDDDNIVLKICQNKVVIIICEIKYHVVDELCEYILCVSSQCFYRNVYLKKLFKNLYVVHQTLLCHTLFPIHEHHTHSL